MAKILLVEDDNNLREVYEDRLLAEGYDIVSARDGEEALTVAMKERPDLIISDVMMPKISGFDMLDIIRSTEETKDVKVIMMTALSQAEDRDRATKLGADRYLVKSQVTLEDVAKAARDVLAGIELPKDDATTTTPTASAPSPAQTPQDPALSVAPAVSVAPTPAPAPQPITTQDPVTEDPAVAPAPEPVSTPSTPAPVVVTPSSDEPAVAPVTNPALEAIAPVTTTEEESAVESSNPESIAEEQSAIAKQIESFIDSKKTAPEPVASPDTPEVTAEPTIVTDQQPPSATKRVIQPLSNEDDPKPDLESLLVKEELKDEIAQVVQQVTTANNDKADEVIAQSVLKKASVENSQAPVTESNPEDLQIGNDGQLSGVTVTPQEEVQPQASEVSEVQPVAQQVITPTEQVIPHTNGSSIDGVSSPQQPSATPPVTPPADSAKPAVDPNSIAL